MRGTVTVLGEEGGPKALEGVRQQEYTKNCEISDEVKQTIRYCAIFAQSGRSQP